MISQRSTFDKLVDTLSTEEAQAMLLNISSSTRNSADIEAGRMNKNATSVEQDRNRQLSEEPFIIRLWFHIAAFFKSKQVGTVYENELLRRIGRNLQQNYKEYVNIKKHTFQAPFYDLLKELRKTQLFFTSLLSAYNTDKGNFYLLISSFSAPELYAQLIHETDPFYIARFETGPMGQRADFLKRIDERFTVMSASHKSELYLCAHAVEWMKQFCDLPIDKMLLRFTVKSPTDATCPAKFISSELADTASVLTSSKQIPDVVLQALFLLSKQDRINDKTLDLQSDSVTFIADASTALDAIKNFAGKIPISDFARYAAGTAHWMPTVINGGEDWFLLFKNAWKKRFNEKWQLWIAEQKKARLLQQIQVLLGIQQLPPIQYRPWEDLWLVLRFKREFTFSFLSSFFSGLYTSSIQSILSTLLIEGNFYRRENLAEYTNALNTLEKQCKCVIAFDERLSPEGEIGSAFLRYKEKNAPSLKVKAGLEALMRSIETEAKQIITSSLNACKSLASLLNGFIEGNKGSIYAPLVNWGTIQGSNNTVFRAQVEKVHRQLEKTVIILTDAELIEKDT